jgi:hypothetical protein
MKTSPLGSGKVALPGTPAADREFENLLQRAADFFKNRTPPTEERVTEAGESRKRQFDPET